MKKDDEESQKPDLVPFYHDLAERFNLCEDPVNIESMNLIYNVTESPPRLYITAVKKNRFIIKRIIMDEDFTRITRQSKTDRMSLTTASEQRPTAEGE
jgi:hypothetical protein